MEPVEKKEKLSHILAAGSFALLMGILVICSIMSEMPPPFPALAKKICDFISNIVAYSFVTALLVFLISGPIMFIAALLSDRH